MVVVGGGYGGATAARHIRMWSEGRIDVTIVEPNLDFISCPLSNLVLGGSRTLTELTVSYDNLARRHGVRFVRDTATAIDADKRVVKLARGGDLPYDRLILSPGVDFMWDKVPALDNAAGAGDDPARMEGRPADRGAAPAAGGDARRRRLRAVDPGRAVSLPAGAVRARVPGRLVLQAREAEVEGAGARRQRRRHFEGTALQEGVGGGVPGHRRVPAELRADRRRRRDAHREVRRAGQRSRDVLNIVPPQRASAIARPPAWSPRTTAGATSTS